MPGRAGLSDRSPTAAQRSNSGDEFEDCMARLGTLKPLVKAAEFRTVLPPAKQADPELKTAAHEAWRKQVLDNARWRCQAPGCSAQGGRGGVRLFADHIIERQDGGAPLDPRNGQALCGKHHSLKTAAARARRIHDRHQIGE